MKNIRTYLVYFWLTCLSTLCFLSQANAQGVIDDFGYVSYSVKLGESSVNFHVYAKRKSFSQKKPLFLYLQGSGAEPIFQKSEKGVLNQLFIGPQEVGDEYVYVVIDKPAVPFVSNSEFETPQQYHDLLTGAVNEAKISAD